MGGIPTNQSLPGEAGPPQSSGWAVDPQAVGASPTGRGGSLGPLARSGDNERGQGRQQSQEQVQDQAKNKIQARRRLGHFVKP